VRYLDEAHTMEVGLARVLQSQIAMAPLETYRSALEGTWASAGTDERVQARISELEARSNRCWPASGALRSC
jgi:hypothetical protein